MKNKTIINEGENVMSADYHAGKAQFDEFPRQESKAYLFGVYLGDGCCSKFTRHYCFHLVSEDRDVIERTKIIVNQLIQKDYPVKEIKPNKTKLYQFRAWNKSLFEMLTSQTKNKTRLPEFVVNADSKVKSEFIAGLMDTDGYISTGTNKFGQQRFSLGFINSGKWLNEFIILLQKFGIKVGKKTLKKKYRSENEKDCYQININLRSFVESGLYFRCQRKQQIFEKYKSSVRYQSF